MVVNCEERGRGGILRKLRRFSNWAPITTTTKFISISTSRWHCTITILIMLRWRKKKKITFIIVNNNKNNAYNYKENANYIVAMFNDLLSRFSKARKIKWPSFLLTKGSTLLKRKSIISFALNEWKLGLTYRIKEILSFCAV